MSMTWKLLFTSGFLAIFLFLIMFGYDGSCSKRKLDGYIVVAGKEKSLVGGFLSGPTTIHHLIFTNGDYKRVNAGIYSVAEVGDTMLFQCGVWAGKPLK